MKKGFLTLFMLLFTLFSHSQISKKVLFIGNSYTAVNNLPSLVSSIATSFGDMLIYDSNTPGGYTFNAHHTNSTTRSKINADNWDYVVLQEQSQLPSFPPAQVESDCYPYADSLNKFIQENDSCTRTMFYMTWGRKNGDASNCASYPVVCTYDGMQGRLRQSYLEMANNLDAEVSPVGAVWKKFRQDFPAVELYQADESHPSIHGSYLAACTFYATIYHKTPAGSSFLPAGITSQEASDIQNTVEAVVFDSLQIWRIDTTTVNAAFTSTLVGTNSYDFTPDFQNGDVYYWDFDGGADTLYTPSAVNHYFPGPGTYVITLIVGRKCDFDTLTQNLMITPFSIGENNFAIGKIYPNPAKENLQVELTEKSLLTLYDMNGRKLFSYELAAGNHPVDLAKIPSGNYILEITNGTASQIEKLVILPSEN